MLLLSIVHLRPPCLRAIFSRHRLQVIPIFLKSLSLANDISGELNGGPPLPPGPVMLGTDEEANRAICQRIFEQIDADATGGLDENDLHRALERLHVHLPLKRAARMLLEIDTDGDGLVDLDEFVRCATTSASATRAAEQRALSARKRRAKWPGAAVVTTPLERLARAWSASPRAQCAATALVRRCAALVASRE